MCWWRSCVYWAINNANASLRHWDINNNKWNYIKCDKCISKSNLRRQEKKGFSRREWNFRCLLNWKKSKQRKLSNAPHTLCELYCYNRCSQTLQHPEKHHIIHWPIYSPVCKPTKPEVIWEHRLNDIQEKSLQYKQVNTCWKFQQWIKTTPLMSNWEITHRCISF